ncbi:N,N-dimethylformamidase beta subunit family domain-containing protein [Archangium sp.]|uniref:N,N-dimethylformamidase beta subunit family domain-containing protein n=1 Tax=Archangium sp. TaxID=1872627 RepID=UPI002D430B59|nr:N,N-dimethylformamidase beta subunit family domain-containing protein [Archangium sp.]HYO52789.1 N,N-dimethylformamidase beta subunit family domain-containing protein [Archangium sp.]
MGTGVRIIGVLAAVLCLLSLAGGCEDTGLGTGDLNGGGRDNPPLQRSDGGEPDIVDGGPTQLPEDGGPDPVPLPPHDAQAIRRENARPGTKAWRITRGANNNEIEGYALVSTVTQGERVPIAVSVAGGPRKFSWEVYRLGYYGALGGREVVRGGPLQAVPQAPCPPQKPTGIIACNWTPTLELETNASWVRGVYVVKLVREDGYQRYVPFFVRDARPRSEVTVIIPTTTWAAYNTWGGTSLYDDKFRITGRGRAFQSSFDRPYSRGHGLGHLLEDEQGLIMWLEAQGLDVAYVPNEELERSGDALREAKVLMLSGHDEYWTRTLRDRADKAVAEGRSIINLGANQAYWQVRLEPAVDGRPRRIVTCYKGDAQDPMGPRSADRTTKFRDLAVPRPENALLGVMFSSRWHQFAFPMVITDADHWAFEGTGLRNGDTLWRANGYEQDQVVDNGQSPAGLEVLAESPALSLQGAFGFGQMVVFRKGNAWVFSAGGVDFVHTLGTSDAADPRAARLVANVLYRALGRAVPKDLVVLPATPLPRSRGPFASAVRTVAGEPGRRGDQDGGPGRGLLAAPVAVAVLPGGGWAVADAMANKVKRVAPDGSISTLSPVRLNGPMGIAADAQGNVYVADSDNSCIRRIAPDGTTTVFAGAVTQPGLVDGLAAQARFNQPAGLTVTAQGELLVADLGNGVIRRIDLLAPDNPVTTLPSNLWLYRPSAVAAGVDGTVYVVETGMSRVVALRNGTVSVVAGAPPGGFADGAAERARLLPYLGLAVLADGSLAVSDPGNYRVRRISPGGEVTTLAGSGRFGSRDGAGDGAELVLPAGLAVGPDGTLYVAESGNALLRAITP